jgi:hypothetical protein
MSEANLGAVQLLGSTFQSIKARSGRFPLLYGAAIGGGIGCACLGALLVLAARAAGLPTVGTILLILPFVVIAASVWNVLALRIVGTDDSLPHALKKSLGLSIQATVLLLCATLMCCLGFVALIIPGVILVIMFSVAMPELVFEDEGGWRSLWSSAALAKGNYVAIFVYLFIVGCGMAVLLELVKLVSMWAQIVVSLLLLPWSSLATMTLHRALKGQPTLADKPYPGDPGESGGGALTAAAVIALALLLSAGGAAYVYRDKLGAQLLTSILNFRGGAARQGLNAMMAGMGEPTGPLPVLGPLHSEPAMAPFDSQWAGVRPGQMAVDTKGDIFVRGAAGDLARYDYTMGQAVTMAADNIGLSALAVDDAGNFFRTTRGDSMLTMSIQELGSDFQPQAGWNDAQCRVATDAMPALAGAALGVWSMSSATRIIRAYDQNGVLQRQGLLAVTDPGRIWRLSIAADHLGNLYVLTDSMTAAAPVAGSAGKAAPALPIPVLSYTRHLFKVDSVPNDPAAPVHVAWDLPLPVSLGDGYGLVGVSWPGVPYVADRHGLAAYPSGAMAKQWPFEFNVPLRGFAVDAWGAAHFLDYNGVMRRIKMVEF